MKKISNNALIIIRNSESKLWVWQAKILRKLEWWNFNANCLPEFEPIPMEYFPDFNLNDIRFESKIVIGWNLIWIGKIMFTWKIKFCKLNSTIKIAIPLIVIFELASRARDLGVKVWTGTVWCPQNNNQRYDKSHRWTISWCETG